MTNLEALSVRIAIIEAQHPETDFVALFCEVVVDFVRTPAEQVRLLRRLTKAIEQADASGSRNLRPLVILIQRIAEGFEARKVA